MKIQTNYHSPVSFRAVGYTQKQLEDLKKEWRANRSIVIARCIELAWTEAVGSQREKEKPSKSIEDKKLKITQREA